MRILLTGGTGTLGHEIVRRLWDNKDVERIVIYSRGEKAQVDMNREWPEYPKNIIRYDIGDVRDKPRLTQAMRGIDIVIHAAALKHIDKCEYNPQEALSTNVIGSQNVVDACNIAGVKKCIVVSTDKAVAPITLYGASKLMMERLAISANNMGPCRFSVVRYANVRGSNGSVIPLWRDQFANRKPLTITDKRMSRMWISIEDAAAFILSRFKIMKGGEIYVPQCKAERLLDTASQCLPLRIDNDGDYHFAKPKFIETGIRPSEKLYEVLISESDARDCWKLPDGTYVCYPPIHDWIKEYKHTGVKMSENFSMCSEIVAANDPESTIQS
jgi:UDP-N-acetylglucosamine 4,6-dehydratase